MSANKSAEVIKSVTGRELLVSDNFLGQTQSGKMPNLCKVCGETGLRLLQVTVLTHTRAENWNLVSDGFRFCANFQCDVVYFNNNTNVYFLRDEIKTRFGPKASDGEARPVCYCLGVLEEHIRYEALKKGCCDSLEDIVEYTKAGTGKWCLTTNPSGKCCREYLPTIVEKYLSMKEAHNARPRLQQVKDKLLETEIPTRRIVLKVSGMSCESCSTHVSAVIEKIGGKNVKVSLKEGSAELLAPGEVQPDELAKAIEESGYGAQVISVERAS